MFQNKWICENWKVKENFLLLNENIHYGVLYPRKLDQLFSSVFLQR